jgi:hypothetical protein
VARAVAIRGKGKKANGDGGADKKANSKGARVGRIEVDLRLTGDYDFGEDEAVGGQSD